MVRVGNQIQSWGTAGERCTAEPVWDQDGGCLINIFIVVVVEVMGRDFIKAKL